MKTKNIKSKINFILILSIIHISLLGCSTSGKLHVETDPPGADIFVIADNQPPRKIGQSPMTVEEGAIGTARATYRISINKAGFQPDSLLIAPFLMPRETRIMTKLKPLTLPASCQNSEESISRVAQGVAEIQALIRAKDFENAEKKLIVFTTDYSTISVFFDLLGNVHYLKKNLDQALIAYRKSYAINPQNSGTARMIKKIESIRGGVQ
jgi:hypothetical protein